MTLSEISAPELKGQTTEGAAVQVVRAPAAPRWRFLRFHPALIVVVGACAVLLRDQMRSGLAGDVFYQVAAGQWMLAHHAVIRHDVFSYTVAGRPWLADEWGFEVLLAWLVNHIGAVSYWLVSAGACVAAAAGWCGPLEKAWLRLVVGGYPVGPRCPPGSISGSCPVPRT